MSDPSSSEHDSRRKALPVPAGRAALAIEGEAGIGKSILWLEAVRAAKDSGLHVSRLGPGGRRLFDQLPQRVELEQTDVSRTGGVTHISYRVAR